MTEQLFTRARAVGYGSELRRIEALPRRTWAAPPELIARMSQWAGGKLYAHQCAALDELYRVRGLFAPMRVGAGKTLISFLAPSAINARRAVLLVPAKLVEKTQREFETYRRAGWRAPENIVVESYERLSRDYGRSILDAYAPDLVIADEVHKLSNRSAACTRKAAKYFRSHPETILAALTGTAASRSLRQFGHFLTWTLREKSPIPRAFEQMIEWCLALDVSDAEDRPVEPGALLRLAHAEDRSDGADELTVARRAFRRRLYDTPGVVAYGLPYDDVPLDVRPWECEVSAPESAWRALRERWELPDETPLEDGMRAAAAARQLALGFFYRLSPPPPEQWRRARRAWAQICRHVIIDHHFADSERMVIDWACADRDTRRGKLWDETRAAWDVWDAVRREYDPEQHREAVWLSDGPRHAIAEWGRRPGIVWTAQIAFADALARETGWPYFGEQGVNAQGQSIESASGDQTVIASIAANRDGRNLQRWSRNLVTCLPSDGGVLEQLIGRTHREGQTRAVTVEWLCSCREHLRAWESVLRSSQFASDMLAQHKVLNFTDIALPTPDESLRWGTEE